MNAMSASPGNRRPDAPQRRRRLWANGIVSGVLVLALAGVTVMVVERLLAGAPAHGRAAAPSADTATPAPTPTMDPIVSHELRTALKKIRGLPGVASAVDDITLTYDRSYPDDPLGTHSHDLLGRSSDDPNGAAPNGHTFHSRFTVAMTPDATAAQSSAVVLTLGRVVSWSGVDLTLTTPATSDRVATSQFWSGTFDGNVGEHNATGVADGLFALAVTPGVHILATYVPYTGRVDYGSLTIGLNPSDDATKARVLDVVAHTAFRDTTLHGSFANGAKP
jgi:hypothetical protein